MEDFSKPVRIFDIAWFTANANKSTGTVQTFRSFASEHLYEYNQPGKSYTIADPFSDARLFVFLSQLWEAERKSTGLDDLMVDALILYALEGTDPEKSLFRSRTDIMGIVAKHVKYDVSLLQSKVDERLEYLCGKVKRVHHHRKVGGYCLPFATRSAIQEMNLQDALVHQLFVESTQRRLEEALTKVGANVTEPGRLIEVAVNRLYQWQGLEFADFVLQGENPEALEKNLPDLVAKVVDESTIVMQQKEKVKSALMTTIRGLVYGGTADERSFLQKLSHTYLMLFLLQCEPKLALFFSTMASKLQVFVCTSILIPAMSEVYLPPENRRYWNLLAGAHKAGVTMLVNETIINELASHFRMISSKYEDEYRASEAVYLGDEIETLYVDDIMIRAYLYAKSQGKVPNFTAFIDNFASPSLTRAEDDLIAWLEETFGIEYKTNASLGVNLDPDEEAKLYEALRKLKSEDVKARSKTRLVLTLLALREMRNERGDAGIFGYNTWWLSKDSLTQKAVKEALGTRYPVSCYMRPDFLYNCISLAPPPSSIDATYQAVFPSLLGVNLSHHFPPEVTSQVHSLIGAHSAKPVARLKAILRDLTESLQANPANVNSKYVRLYLDEQLRKADAGS